MAKYKFSDRPEKGTVTVSEGYAALVITDQVAEVDLTDPEQSALAEKLGGKPVVVNVVEKKSGKKAAESKVKNRQRPSEEAAL